MGNPVEHRTAPETVSTPGDWLRAGASAELAIATAKGDEIVVDLYSWLGVAPHATADQIRDAYYARAMHLHPDRNPGDIATAETLKSIIRGADILRDPRMRKLYDRGEIDAAGRLTPTGAGRRRRAFFGKAFGIYFLGPFMTGVVVITAFLWAQAPVAAGRDPVSRGTAPVIATNPPAWTGKGGAKLEHGFEHAANDRSSRVKTAALGPSGANGRLNVPGGSAENVTKPDQETDSLAARLLEKIGRSELASPSKSEAAAAGLPAPDGRGPSSRIAPAEFEALATAALSNLAGEIEKRSKASKPSSLEKSPASSATLRRERIVTALERARERRARAPHLADIRKAPNATVLALNRNQGSPQREGHAFERPSCQMTKACRANQDWCSC